MKNRTFAKFNLHGKTAFVTGGSLGLGYYMARGLASAGAKIMIAARREGPLIEAAKKLEKESGGNQVLYTCVDLNDDKSIQEAADFANSRLNGVDIYVGNAGIDVQSKVDDITEEQIQSTFQVNYSANIFLIKRFLPHMRAKRWGRIILSASIASIRAPVEGLSVYSSAKAAVNAYAKVAAAELGQSGITVNSLNIGSFLTDMLLELYENVAKSSNEFTVDSLMRRSASNTALGRLGNPEEIEGLVQLLASDAGSYITGANLPIDGGQSILLRPIPLPD